LIFDVEIEKLELRFCLQAEETKIMLGFHQKPLIEYWRPTFH
jgi:hypothetical protein